MRIFGRVKPQITKCIGYINSHTFAEKQCQALLSSLRQFVQKYFHSHTFLTVVATTPNCIFLKDAKNIYKAATPQFFVMKVLWDHVRMRHKKTAGKAAVKHSVPTYSVGILSGFHHFCHLILQVWGCHDWKKAKYEWIWMNGL